MENTTLNNPAEWTTGGQSRANRDPNITEQSTGNSKVDANETTDKKADPEYETDHELLDKDRQDYTSDDKRGLEQDSLKKELPEFIGEPDEAAPPLPPDTYGSEKQ
ncbi:MAG: hypothetical protein V4722_10255 [Bacteroidota bacterium]